MQAKAAMIWIIGEYAERMDNADELLERFVENFKEETTDVQLSLLTAVIKVYLKNPTGTKEMAQGLLKEVTTNMDNPDLRDRGYVYWRLLSLSPEVAKSVVLAEKPVIGSDTTSFPEALLDKVRVLETNVKQNLIFVSF
jgi:vesicle coat complex subunit